MSAADMIIQDVQECQENKTKNMSFGEAGVRVSSGEGGGERAYFAVNG